MFTDLRFAFSRALYSGCLFLVIFGAPGSVCGGPLVQETSEEYYPVASEFTLTVHNTDGAIRVYGAETNEVKVEAIKRAYSPERLAKIAVNVLETPGGITIETVFPPPTPHGFYADRSGTVEYNIVVPQSCKLTNLELSTGEILCEGLRGGRAQARLTNGRMVAKNCFTAMQFALERGGLDFYYDWWEQRPMPISVETKSSGVRAIFPNNAAFKIAAASDSGQIAYAFAPRAENPDPHRLTAEYGNNPNADLKIHTVSGNIRIDEAY